MGLLGGDRLLLLLGLLLFDHELLLLIVGYLLDEDTVADWSLLILIFLYLNIHAFSLFFHLLILLLQLNPT